ncbi:MAG: zinc-binding alcohol dehydrogenase [Fimbriimonadaceae bacterium]
MKRLVCLGPEEIGWQPVEAREPGPGEVRIRCEFGVEKHGTMQAFYRGYANARGRWDPEMLLHRTGEGMLWSYPVPLGNMQFGRVAACGPGVDNLAEGDRVAVGAPFQPEVVAPASGVWPMPEGTDWTDMALLDPAEFALGAIRDGHVRLGDAVAVFGLGAIGLCVVQLARAAGASRIVAIDPIASRREIARATGADDAIDPAGTDVGLALKETIRGGPDVVLDFSGSVHALQAALRGVAYGGTIVLGAFPPPFGAGLDLGAEAHMNRPNVVFSRACSDPNPDHPRWNHRRIQETAYDLILSGRLQGGKIVGPTVPFDTLLDAYPKIADRPSDFIKLAVSYPPSSGPLSG